MICDTGAAEKKMLGVSFKHNIFFSGGWLRALKRKWLIFDDLNTVVASDCGDNLLDEPRYRGGIAPTRDFWIDGVHCADFSVLLISQEEDWLRRVGAREVRPAPFGIVECGPIIKRIHDYNQICLGDIGLCMAEVFLFASIVPDLKKDRALICIE